MARNRSWSDMVDVSLLEIWLGYLDCGYRLGYQAAFIGLSVEHTPSLFPTYLWLCVCMCLCVCLVVPAACRAVALPLTPQNIIFNYLSRSVWLLSPSNFRQEKDNTHAHARTHTVNLCKNLAHCLWDKRRCRCRCRCRLRCLLAEKKNVVENCAIVLQFIGERACLT